MTSKTPQNSDQDSFQKLYHIIYINHYTEPPTNIPISELLDVLPNLYRHEVVSTNLHKLQITLEKVHLQYPYYHFTIMEKQ
jgi:hypothetical protein